MVVELAFEFLGQIQKWLIRYINSMSRQREKMLSMYLIRQERIKRQVFRAIVKLSMIGQFRNRHQLIQVR
jgi:hypothetical protein